MKPPSAHVPVQICDVLLNCWFAANWLVQSCHALSNISSYFWKASSWWFGRMWCREQAAGGSRYSNILQGNLREKLFPLREGSSCQSVDSLSHQRSWINQIWEQTRTQRSHPTLFIQTFLTKTQISQRNVRTVPAPLAIHPETHREPTASVCQLKYQLTDHREGSVMVFSWTSVSPSAGLPPAGF